jgi:phosphoglycerol transferase MdoB-like AlkP superfamily enzyme
VPAVGAPLDFARRAWAARALWLLCATGSLAITIVISAALVFAIELIVRGSLGQTLDFFQQPFRPGWTTVALFALLLTGFDALFGRRHNGALLVAPFALLLATIGHQKSLYLGDPLYPTDFLYSRQIVELMPLLVRERPFTAGFMAIGGMAGLFLLAALWRYWRRRFPAIRLRGRIARLAVVVPALAFFVSIMDFATFSWTRDRLQIIPMMWDQKENYASNGFAIAFALNVPMAKVKAPPSYEDDVLDVIAPSGAAGISMPAEKPDVIIVMSESFWDPTLLPRTKITPDPMPNVRAVRSGSMFSPEFGGMTANVEFEALTGFSNAFLPYGSIPYQQYVRGPVPSLATFFRSEGYDTVAMHPFEGWFWNRKHVYDAFGFDRFLSIEALPPMKSRGPLVSDDSLTDEIIRRADEAERPFFTFAVSLQGHGPYEPYRYPDAKTEVESVAGYSTRQSIRSYAEGIADADRSLKRLMDWASKRDRPTVIVFFGDHLPPLNQGYTETGFLKEPVPERREPPEALALHRETPLVIWSNRTGPVKDVGSISPSLIPLKLFRAAGIKHPYYTGFLGRVDAAYDVIDRHLLMSHAGPISDWSQQQRIDPLINDFRLLQYDAMFGRQRTVKRFFPNLPKPAGV